MKEEGLKSYISKILQLDYRINPNIIVHSRSKFMYVKTLLFRGGFYLRQLLVTVILLLFCRWFAECQTTSSNL